MDKIFPHIAWVNISEVSEMSDLLHKSAISRCKESVYVSVNASLTYVKYQCVSTVKVVFKVAFMRLFKKLVKKLVKFQEK